MSSTLLATHRYQSKVFRQRSDTRDELGFQRRWCWWRCWWRLTPSRWEDHWWWRWLRFPPPGGKFPRQNSSAGALDCFCPGSTSRRRRFVSKASSWFFQVKRHHIAEDGWYVSDVSIIFYCSMLLYYHSWMFYNHFLVLTYWHSAQCQLLFSACFLHRRKSIANGIKTQWNF